MSELRNSLDFALTRGGDGFNLVVSAGVLFYGSFHYGPIYTSTDTGATWTLTSAPTNTWTSVASSADGKKLVAAAHGGGIYTWSATPAPLLNITALPGEAIISWTIPSANFQLQAAPDPTKTNWSNGSNSPVLNLTNLQNEVRVDSTATSSGFFRLKSQ
jgi:hypothetical protein